MLALAVLADGLASQPANSSGAHAAAALPPPLADPLAVGAAIDASLSALSPAEQERLLLTLACGRASEEILSGRRSDLGRLQSTPIAGNTHTHCILSCLHIVRMIEPANCANELSH